MQHIKIVLLLQIAEVNEVYVHDLLYIPTFLKFSHTCKLKMSVDHLNLTNSATGYKL
jgi:hypothetical protein